MAIPMSESSVDVYNDMEATLRRVYIDSITEIIALVPRPPVVMINHDKRFVACAHGTMRRREDFPGYVKACSFVAMELRLRGSVVVHGSSLWCKMVSSLHGAEYGTHVISTEKVFNTEPHHRHYRAFAIYEKQLFCEKMIAACYMNSEILKQCQVLLHCKAIDIPRFKQIWSDNAQLHFASTLNSRDWVPPDRLRTMEEETRRNDDVRRSGRIWQNFEVSLRTPEPVYCPEQCWFMIEEYSTASLAGSGANGKVFFCNGCENQKEETRFCQGNTSFSPSNAYPERCTGSAYQHFYYTSYYKIKDYGELRDSESYSLACAYHIYVNDLQDVRPSDDLMEFLRSAYEAVGKVVSAHGRIRCTPEYALVYPIWGRAKQLSWDRAYDQAGHLCYIAYYDAGNAAYAGFIKMLLSPQQRVELFRGSENPHEALQGDVFELTLGLLTFAIRFPALFDQWEDVDEINACVNGFEKCFIRHSAGESITLITARTPKKRKPAKADAEIERDVQEIIKALPTGRFLGVPTSITLQPILGVTGGEARGMEDAKSSILPKVWKYFALSQMIQWIRMDNLTRKRSPTRHKTSK